MITALSARRCVTRHRRCRLGSDDRENQIRLDGWGRGIVISSAAAKQQLHAQNHQSQQLHAQKQQQSLPHQQHLLHSASSSKTQRVAIPLTSVPPLSVFQHHLQPTQLRANTQSLPNDDAHPPAQLLRNEGGSPFFSAHIHLPDPLELTADYDDNARSSADNTSDQHASTSARHIVLPPRIIVLPSPLSSAAPTPRDHDFLPANGPRNRRDQQPPSNNDEDLMFTSAAHMQSAFHEHQHNHQLPHNVFEPQSSQLFAADLSPVPAAVSPSSLVHHEPPPLRYSPLPVRSVLKLESAIQASSAAAASLVSDHASNRASHAPPRAIPQTSLAIITGHASLHINHA
jgi:hypothetical protein